MTDAAAKESHPDEQVWAEYFNFLDELRESGETNMWGAVPYIKDAFPDLDRATAGKIHSAWMKTFDENKSALYRARTHLYGARA